MLTPFQRVCAQVLGLSPQTATAEDVEARMRVEVTRHAMEAGIFRFNPNLLAAFKTGDAAQFAAAAGIPVPAELPTLFTLDARLDLIRRKLS